MFYAQDFHPGGLRKITVSTSCIYYHVGGHFAMLCRAKDAGFTLNQVLSYNTLYQKLNH